MMSRFFLKKVEKVLAANPGTSVPPHRFKAVDLADDADWKRNDEARMSNDEGMTKLNSRTLSESNDKNGSLEIRHLVINSDFGVRISLLRWPAARFLFEHSHRSLVGGFRVLV